MHNVSLDARWITGILFAALLLTFTSPLVGAGPQEVIIVHTNDIHGHLAPFDVGGEVRGGLARVAGHIEALRGQYGDRVIWLDAGDTWHGSNLANLFGGESVVEVLGAAGLNAMVLGNHDFNYGIDGARERMAQAAFPVLSANVVTEQGEPFAARTAILRVGMVEIGVIGLTTTATPYATHPKNVEGLTFLEPIEVAKVLVRELADKVDLIVAVTHLGVDYDRLLAQAVPEIDVIVGGHSHTLLSEPVVAGNTIIVQANEWAKYLGFLRLEVDGGSITRHEGYLIPITEDAPTDAEVDTLISRWNERLEEHLNVVIGKAAVDLDGAPHRVRTMETNLGNLIADIVRETASAEIALVNGGSIRRSTAAGPITVGDVYEMFPFTNTVVGVELTGAQLIAALENGLSYYPLTSGRFLHVSGLRFAFDPTQPPGQRVQSVYLSSEADGSDAALLDLDRTYRVAVTDFMAVGGDEYTMLVDAPVYFGSTAEGGLMMADLLMAHILSVGTVAPSVTGRIQVQSSLPEGFVYVSEVIPGLELDIRYYGENNFMGRPVTGYMAPECILTDEAAQALAKVQERLDQFGLGLKVFDCYRPAIAVAHFALWAQDLSDTLRKNEFYPEVDKSELFALGYIAERSGHSRGSTVDLTLIDKATGYELDMGTGFDMFSTLSWPDEPSMTAQQRANRLLLQSVMMEHGFIPYDKEWWHFTLADEPYPDTYFEFPVH